MAFRKLLDKAEAKLKAAGSTPGGGGGGPPPIPPKPGSSQRVFDAGEHLRLKEHFVARSPTDGALTLGGKLFRFASFNAPELLTNTPFEQEDTFRSLSAMGIGGAVTRTYTLRVKSWRVPTGAHIEGWDAEKGEWIWNDQAMRTMDSCIALAGQYGVRLIIPIVNQDYGSEETNWVGNITDLTKMVKPGTDWWTDVGMRNAFKILLHTLLTRTNTVNGKVYGQDPTILAWETGNELQERALRPARGEWTADVAKFIAERSQSLVMDGSYARNDSVEMCYAPEALACPDVALFSYHYYGGGDSKRLSKDIAYVSGAHRKAFVAGEFGFFKTGKEFSSFLSTAHKEGATGSLVWSLRPHDEQGGFKTHSEGDGIWSYHVPGWNVQDAEKKGWDVREKDVVKAVLEAAHVAGGVKKRGVYPSPQGKPILFKRGDGSVAWKGSAWAESYEVWVRLEAEGAQGGQGRCVYDRMKDTAPGGTWGLPLGESGTLVRVRGRGVGGEMGEWSDELVL